MQICKLFCNFVANYYDNMSRFKFCLSVWAFLSIVLCANAESISPVYQAYIEQWKATALAQQAEYGIPASITLAQGLLESGAGQSELAQKANNHFGIKCHSDWQGKTYRKRTGTHNECFRSYKKAEDSFRDHSLFLKQKRYEVLFTYNIRDYKAWARGLRACGYATDPKYPDKLIRLIETYGLDKLSGKGKSGGKQKAENEKQKNETEKQKAESGKSNTPVAAQPQPSSSNSKQAVQSKQSKQTKQKAKKPKKEKQPKQKPGKEPKQKKQKEPKQKQSKELKQQTQPKQQKESRQSNPPASNSNNDSNLTVVVLAASEPEQTDTVEWKPSLLRTNKLYADRAYGKTNGRKFIVAQEGDTWGSIAYSLDMEENTLRRINEAPEQQLRGGDRIYLFPKRKRADRYHTRHLVRNGETAWDIAQQYGMRMSELYKLNGIPEGTPLTTEQWLNLR